jgi:tRNA(adenine34) deaminase
MSLNPAELAGAERLMKRLQRLAAKGAALGEVPVAALLVQGPLDAARPKVLAQAHNRTETRPDPTAHAERLVLERAARKLGRWRLNDCTLIVTLEPCAMCAGASVWARVGRIIYGAPDPKAGACGSVLQVAEHPQLNHRIPTHGGVLADECSAQLKAFFQAKRKKG